MTLTGGLRWLRSDIGLVGIAGLSMITVTLALLVFAVRPLEERARSLDEQLEQRTRAASDPKLMLASTSAAKLAAFYQFFETDQATTDWLAKLYAISRKVGVELRAASYKRQKTGTRIERYEIVMPLTGNYAQIRAFLENALIEIPVLSLDQVTFRKKRPNDPTAEAEVRLTLHLLKR